VCVCVCVCMCVYQVDQRREPRIATPEVSHTSPPDFPHISSMSGMLASWKHECVAIHEAGAAPHTHTHIPPHTHTHNISQESASHLTFRRELTFGRNSRHMSSMSGHASSMETRVRCDVRSRRCAIQFRKSQPDTKLYM